ncbi:formate--tetrahydrofolate ligase [Limnochorda pilosa]|uniref:Formate--tetrahydrofolate ligase n=1 Tax=Limnochorda pilosa TaxID=1555112 RepID=A0A0K2SQQ9_LIMPI|nr:formate--tetrahydrofolate ligase [Limnochorda pilosa]BAS29441.1 formate--tetrahydrofolate ligase [Limnochorda pilosa]
MPTDIEIAQSVSLRPIGEIAAHLGLEDDEWEPYGRTKAKVTLEALQRRLTQPRIGRLIYVTAITATAAGEGKTCTAIGLTQGLGKVGRQATVCLREPSLGPTFGIKGGAAGGGYAQVVPMEEINLHFTGDIHAVGTAHNLLAAVIDNHLSKGNALRIDPNRVVWRRVMDMNDRELRQVVVGLGGPANGVVRETGFDITVASEVMAILCLADSITDLKERLGRMLVAYTYEGEPVYARDLGVHGAMAALLRDAFRPNLVQTLEGQPAFVHGGPFANIAHGNNSILATELALRLSELVVTEGGFGADLGAEKFFDIVHGYTGLTPDVVVLVASVRALHMHGGVSKREVEQANPEALLAGMPNLIRHIENVQRFGLPVVVAINRFPTDAPEELELIRTRCAEMGVPVALSDVVARGGEGGVELAAAVLDALDQRPADFRPLYHWNLPITEKLDRLATQIYGADGVELSPAAQKQVREAERNGWGQLPLCVAKTQHSLSDDPDLKGAPTGWKLRVREIRPSLGAGFLVCLAGDVMTMPGLPTHPAAERVDIDASGRITGLF